MSEFAAVSLIAVIVVIIAAVLLKSKNKGSSSNSGGRGGGSIGRTNAFAPWPSAELPSALGVPYGHPARTAAERLESTLGLDFESRVKDRVLKEFPRLSDREWDWTWFELKRYFLMCGILRSVPMYSRQVDAVWHEMLMFTREYEQLCIRYCGEMIHHAPHAPGVQPPPDERAWFDWVYGELFTAAPASGRVWGAFYRTRLSETKLAELAERNGADLREHWFNVKAAAKHSDLSVTAEYLIDRAKSQLAAARRNDKPGKKGTAPEYHKGYDPALGGVGLLSGLLIFHSISNPDAFAQQMDREQMEEERQANGSGSSTSACSGSSDDGKDHSGGYEGGSGGDSGSGGSDGGGGGSSCGGGCSS
ncbi:hypothetical protein L1N85_08160 [Paenibacillus alkaliterrae]|uniref:hypothetical protein n=1 Tax=Paenibacillus alkaliterrae TaxID=320909 RepID=UPI001F29F9AC|nr:hypothetical protein [Paenibacillus alkaliterrae]MCF2938407.1 hypothetical protein [Paenibacillus alkaliterrae]